MCDAYSESLDLSYWYSKMPTKVKKLCFLCKQHCQKPKNIINSDNRKRSLKVNLNNFQFKSPEGKMGALV